MREVLDAIFLPNRSGRRWDMPPYNFPSKSTVHRRFSQEGDDGTWQRIMDAIRHRVRVAVEEPPSPGIVIIDSQTVEGTEVGGKREYNASKILRGTKRHIRVDTLVSPLIIVVTATWSNDVAFASESSNCRPPNTGTS